MYDVQARAGRLAVLLTLFGLMGVGLAVPAAAAAPPPCTGTTSTTVVRSCTPVQRCVPGMNVKKWKWSGYRWVRKTVWQPGYCYWVRT